MKESLYKLLVIIFYIIAFLLILFCIKIQLDSILIGTKIRLLLLTAASLLIYINGYILVRKLNYSDKILKINIVIYFLIYTVTICMITLFDQIYGRNGLIIINWDKNTLNNYIKYSFNIIPFKTIKLYIFGYFNNLVTFKDFFINTIGNLSIFMPYGVFFPLMFKKINRYYKLLILVIIIIVFIELLQFVTMSGSCDIDDLILNVAGVSIIYFVFNIKYINKVIYKIFMLR